MTTKMAKKCFKKAKKTLILAVAFSLMATTFSPALAQTQPLTISNITVSTANQTAIISWKTSRPTTGKVEYGIESRNYLWSLATNLKKTDQAITIFGLQENTTYFFRLTAQDDTAEVRSFEQSFKTGDFRDNTSPVISKVQVVYLTGTTATIQWETDEPATTEVEYGLTTSYGSTKSSGTLVRIHDITLNNLRDGTTYHFRVKSKDQDGNTAMWFDATFRTQFGTASDNAALTISDVKPAAENDITISQTTAPISWRTNKVSQGFVRWGKTPSFGNTVASNPPRGFFNSVTLSNLEPDQRYYFDILARDVLGKEVRSQTFSFVTKSSGTVNSSNVAPLPTGGQVLGVSNTDVLSCDASLLNLSGFYGIYFNHDPSHPDFESFNNNIGVGPENDWFNAQYFAFTRVDTNLQFPLHTFYPIPKQKPGDPNHFAVYWRAAVDVPQTGNYHFTLTSDDDSWLFIDGKLVIDNSKLHGPVSINQEMQFTQGLHLLEIYYADRRTYNATLDFDADSRWTIHPLPENCSIETLRGFQNGSGQVLGTSNINGNGNGAVSTPAPIYACNPDLGYTRIKALYKTAASPDVWALLETGQKHYITSPESFNLYQCDWSKIRTVSQKFLDGFANATLVKTPNEPAIYHLFDRPEMKWLKVNIPSPTIFVSYPKNFWGNVARINHLDIASYPAVTLIKKQNSGTIYLIDGQFKRPFASRATFDRLGYDFIEVVNLNQPHSDSYITGAVID